MTVTAMIRRYKALKEALPDLFRQVLEENKGFLLDANREQLREGRTSEGTRFKKYKSDAYAQKKHRQNPLAGYGYPDLTLSGRFLQGFDLKISGNVVSFYSSDIKTPMLSLRFDENLIFGTTDENRDALVKDVLKPALIQKIKNYLTA